MVVANTSQMINLPHYTIQLKMLSHFQYIRVQMMNKTVKNFSAFKCTFGIVILLLYEKFINVQSFCLGLILLGNHKSCQASQNYHQATSCQACFYQVAFPWTPFYWAIGSLGCLSIGPTYEGKQSHWAPLGPIRLIPISFLYLDIA